MNTTDSLPNKDLSQGNGDKRAYSFTILEHTDTVDGITQVSTTLKIKDTQGKVTIILLNGDLHSLNWDGRKSEYYLNTVDHEVHQSYPDKDADIVSNIVGDMLDELDEVLKDHGTKHSRSDLMENPKSIYRGPAGIYTRKAFKF